MGRRKLTDAQVEAMMQDYYRWNPDDPASETAEQLALRHGVSKATLYNIKERYEKTRGQALRAEQTQRNHTEEGSEDLQAVIRYLTGELVKAKVDNERLRQQLTESKKPRT